MKPESKNLPTEERLASWEQSAADQLGLADPNDPTYVDLRTIFSKKNFSDTAGQEALNTIGRLQNSRTDSRTIVTFLKDKFKYHKYEDYI